MFWGNSSITVISILSTTVTLWEGPKLIKKVLRGVNKPIMKLLSLTLSILKWHFASDTGQSNFVLTQALRSDRFGFKS